MKTKNKIFTIPNILSFIRIGLIPLIAIFYLNNRVYLSVFLIVLSAFTDVVDGFIARRFNMVSDLGKALDPIADKLTLFTLIICLFLKQPLMIILLVLFIIKEVIMGVEGILIIKLTKTTYSAKWYGKITTVVLYLTMLILILFTSVSKEFVLFLILISSSFMILSLVLYSLMNIRKIILLIKSKINQ